MGKFAEIWGFVKARRKYWLAPIIIVLLLLGVVLVGPLRGLRPGSIHIRRFLRVADGGSEWNHAGLSVAGKALCRSGNPARAGFGRCVTVRIEAPQALAVSVSSVLHGNHLPSLFSISKMFSHHVVPGHGERGMVRCNP